MSLANPDLVRRIKRNAPLNAQPPRHFAAAGQKATRMTQPSRSRHINKVEGKPQRAELCLKSRPIHAIHSKRCTGQGIEADSTPSGGFAFRYFAGQACQTT